GVPYDASSSFLRGAAQAPPAIRQALHTSSSNLCSESGLDLGVEPRWRDAGDLDFGDLDFTEGRPPYERIGNALHAILDGGARALTLGGDHAIAHPILEVYGRHFEGLNLLQLDAHPDLYDELDGNRYSHACPFARIMEAGLVQRLVQVGIRTLNPHQRAQAERFGVEILTMRRWPLEQPLEFTGPLYLSLDLDVLDPAFAPGVSHHEPGGLSVREVIRLIQSLDADLVGADVVELNPTRDPTGVTAMVAAKLLKEIAARMLEG
ncbi:MAG: agmatinase, partial [Acidobacteriota bacterium]